MEIYMYMIYQVSYIDLRPVMKNIPCGDMCGMVPF